MKISRNYYGRFTGRTTLDVTKEMLDQWQEELDRDFIDAPTLTEEFIRDVINDKALDCLIYSPEYDRKYSLCDTIYDMISDTLYDYRMDLIHYDSDYAEGLYVEEEND